PNGLDESSVPVPPSPDWPPPESCPVGTFEEALGWRTFGEALDLRLAFGEPFRELGPAAVWARLRLPLFAGEPIHPLDRALTLADFPNGFGNSVPFDRFQYINPDLTVSLHRLPTTEWLLLDAGMHASATGHGTAGGTLADENGPIGTCVQTLLVSAR